MDEQERTILNHYNIALAFPQQWPAEKDDSDDSDEDINTNANVSGSDNKINAKLQHRRSKPRHSALGRLASSSRRRSRGDVLDLNDDDTQDTPEMWARKDEPDPLGFSDSVVRMLRQRGLPVDEDARLRKNSTSLTILIGEVILHVR